MPARFLLDEDLSPRVAEIARGRGLDVVSVHEVGRRGYGDREQLAHAAGEERLLVTRNRDDFILLTVECFHAGRPHAGLLIVPHTLPNRDPERIAAGLESWAARHVERGGSTRYLIDFLGP